MRKAKCLKDARGSIPEDVNLKTLSKFVLTVMKGGVMQSRTHRAIEPFDASVEHLRGYFHLLIALHQQAELTRKQWELNHNNTEEDR
jgi:hypothetical protein